jgi:hypothetical protein
MGRSVAEVRQYLEESQCKVAVWDRVVNFLSGFLDTETREAKESIRFSKDSPFVSQELIAEIIQDIEAKKISPLKTEIKTLENLPVVETKDGNSAQGERTEARPKANAKRVRIVAKPG